MWHRVQLLAVVLLEATTVLALHGLAGHAWAAVPTTAADLAATGDLDLVMSLVRLAALALGWWCLATTVLAAIVHRSPRVADHTRRRALALVPGFLRERVRVGVAGLAVSSVLLGPAAAVAAPLPPGIDPGTLTRPVPAAQQEGADDLLPPGLTTLPPAAPSVHDSWRQDASGAVTPVVDVSRPVAPAASVAAGTHVVRPGEHLWAIARQQLVRAGTDVDDDRIADHWRRLVEANLSSLPGGDPDVVHPGHVLTLVEVAP